ncbi:copper resistance CopC family protein [Microbacterium lushaniae]|uniref:copper resistance CopC family protein n=1 Tax=Microbacterium lushaniae TaxID=2614639 RepID=UPI0017809E78|nr:copper resistance CopC family protein [Microbacterium lushaniae]
MTPDRFRIHPLTALATVLLMGLALLWGAASPAAAHDQLVSTDPEAGAELTALPETLTLTFSAELLGADDANQVQVTDAAGTALAEGPAVVAGTTLTQALSGEPSGSIQVVWRVVSSDGHPISGEFAFTVTPPAPTQTPTAAPEPSETATPTDSAEPSPSPTLISSEDGEDGADPLPWIVGAVVLVVVIGVVVYLLVIRPRRAQTGSGTRDGR